MLKYVILLSSSIPILIHYFVKKKYIKMKENLEIKLDNDYNHHFISLSMQNFKCRRHVFDKKECSQYCSFAQMKRVINFISSAQTSISICMYTITLREVAIELIRAQNRGVRVRVITDRVMNNMGASKTHILKKYDIPFKVQQSEENMMHHKFCLIDETDESSAKMFFGSLNLTLQGFVCNFDHISLTNNWDIIQRYSNEFEEMWLDFK